MGIFSKLSNSSAKHPNQKSASFPPKSLNPLIGEYSHLSSLPRADEALQILHQLASKVKPIMQKRNWRVGTLAEFLPDYYALQGYSPYFPY